MFLPILQPDRIKQHYMSMKVSDLDPEVGAVVVSFDEDVNYVKLMKVASYLTSEECLFIATNTDETYPIGGSIVMPAAGAFVKAIEFCTKRKAFVVGKPYEYVQKYLQSYNLKPARTLMIGDKYVFYMFDRLGYKVKLKDCILLY